MERNRLKVKVVTDTAMLSCLQTWSTVPPGSVVADAAAELDGCLSWTPETTEAELLLMLGDLLTTQLTAQMRSMEEPATGSTPMRKPTTSPGRMSALMIKIPLK
jgi:hypothetical protein